jgi:hypothetical protein
MFGQAFSSGPVVGEVTATWTPPPDTRLTAGPIVTTDGRVALALTNGVVFLDPGTLLPVGQVTDEKVTRVGWIAAAPDDAVMFATRHKTFRIARGGAVQTLELARFLHDQAPTRLFTLSESVMVAASDEHVAVVAQDGSRALSHIGLKSTMAPVVGHAALSTSGMIYVANAMSWPSHGEAPEYHGHLIGLRPPDLSVRFVLDQGRNGLPAAAGLELQLAAYGHGAVLSERGIAGYDEVGNMLFGDDDVSVKPPFAVAGRELMYVKGRPRSLIHAVLPRALNDTTPPRRTVFTLGPDEEVRALAGAAEGDQWYVSTSRRLLGLGRNGNTLFEMPGVSPRALACGNGCLFAVHEPLRLVKIG